MKAGLLILFIAFMVVTGLVESSQGQLLRRRSSRSCNQVAFAKQQFAFVDQYAFAANQQPIVIQNNFPGPLAGQGSSVYGYSAYSSGYDPFSIDPAAVLREAARLTETSQSLTQESLATYKTLGQDVLRYSAISDQLRARAELIQATDPNPQTGQLNVSQSQSITLEPDGRGGFSIRLGTSGVSSGAGGGSNAPSDVSVDHATSPGAEVFKNRCASCHTGTNAMSGIQFFQDSGEVVELPEDIRKKIIAETNLGNMPPEPQDPLSDEEFLALRAWLFPTENQ